jgi:flagellar basal body-associated protein FliL
MADEELPQEQPAEAPPPAEEVPLDGMPGMQDAMGGTGGGDTAKSITLRWWLVLILGIVVVSAFFGFYRYGYIIGYRSVYQGNLNNMQAQTPFTDPQYPIMGVQANLADDQIPKFINLSVHLALSNNEGLQECAMREAALRDVLLTLLTRKKSFDIDSATEQRKLKRLMKDELNASLEKTRVKEIYLTDFMIGYRIYVQLDESASFLNAHVRLKPETKSES